MTLARNDVVLLVTPDNPKFNGMLAVVTAPAEWGAHVRVNAWAPGLERQGASYRALANEMVVIGHLPDDPPAPAPPTKAPGLNREQAKHSGYTGDTCATCGSLRMTRNGACLKCEACGSTTGCS